MSDRATAADGAETTAPEARRVLVVEDDAGLNRLACKTLRRAGFDARGVPTGGEAVERLRADADRMLLLDQGLPDMTGTDLIRALAETGLRVPFVAMTGQGDERTAVEMMKLGARDYLVKGVDLVDLLPEVFRRVFREWETERRLARAERELREREERYARLFNSSSDAIFVHRLEDGGTGKFVEVNDVACARLEYSRDELLALSPKAIDAGDFERTRCAEMKSLMETGTAVFETVHRSRSGRRIPVEISVRVFESRGRRYLLSIARDLTERKRAEAEKARLEEQIHQAQRLESIGRLAGGVAHDLNNLLSPILGYGEMLLEETDAADPRRPPLEQIVKAGTRSRDLVRQLLAFGRKQTLAFAPVDLNGLLRDFDPLLRRTIREDVAIRLRLAPSLPPIRGDAGQLEQVMMNLAVNAQDAMPEGGVLTVETSAVELRTGDPELPNEMAPGRYVLLSVADTGCGMGAETLEHLFEPFYTTKEIHKGTGLGLATVYGIVKQHGGHVRGENRPGGGAIFRVRLPVCEETAEASEEPPVPAAVDPGGSETVLLVEDSEPVRTLARTILEREGYTVLAAESGGRALALLADYDGPIHLLLTDVVMPEINGKELYRRVSGLRPDVRVLFMSGYADDVLADRGVANADVPFIQKPFSVQALSEKLREVLGTS